MSEFKAAAVKGSFSGRNSRGVFAFAISSDDAAVREFVCAVKSGDSLSSIDLYTPYSDLVKIIGEHERSAREDPALGSIINGLSERFSGLSEERARKILNLIQSPGDDYLKNILIRDILSEEIAEGFEELSGKVEVVLEQLDKDSGPEVEQALPEAEQDQTVIVAVKPQLDPIKGKTVDKLTLGDRMIVKLAEPAGAESYISRLTAFEDGSSSPSRYLADITEIKTDDSGYYKIMAKLGGGLFSMIKLRPGIKLAVYMPIESGTSNAEDGTEEQSGNFDLMLVAMGVLIFILLFVIGMLILFR